MGLEHDLPPAPFADRREAGRRLAPLLGELAGRDDVMVLGLPRGGVAVAFEVALALDVPLDVFMVRKLGAPHQPELAIGAIATGGVQVVAEDLVRRLGVTPAHLGEVVERERRELERRQAAYRRSRPPLRLGGRTVVLVDDGIATGSTMRAALDACRLLGPVAVVAAAPVAAPPALDLLRPAADRVVCLSTPQPFRAIGQWYVDFAQTTDAEVRRLLEAALHRRARSPTQE